MYSIELLSNYHNNISIIMVAIWLVIAYIGYQIKLYNNKLLNRISFLLIGFSIIQEILDYINRLFLDDLYVITLSQDLPLHLCHFGFYFSLIAIYFKSSNKKISDDKLQFYFDIAYVTGFSGALQGILTVDWDGINNLIGVVTGHLQHSLIILNTLWLIFAYDMKFSISGVKNSLIFLNLIIIPIGFINYIIGANYFFLCEAPDVNNPLLLTKKWPYYILIIDIIAFIYVYILYLPFKFVKILKDNSKSI